MKILKAEITALNTRHKAKTNLKDIYELGKQTAHRGDSIDTKPSYRTHNKSAAWLKGYADGQLEQEAQALKNQINRAGITKLKAVIKQVLEQT